MMRSLPIVFAYLCCATVAMLPLGRIAPAQDVTARDIAPATSTAAASVPWQTWARSVEGRPIDIARLGSGPRQVLIVAGLRGDDVASVELAGRLAAHFADFPLLLDGATATIVRDANPDGHARRTIANSRGVELDHNFSSSNWRKLTQAGTFISGRLPDSEPETQALAELVEQTRPDRVVILESGPAAPSVSYQGAEPDWAGKLALDARMPAAGIDLASLSGSLAAFAGHDRAASCVVVSLPRVRDPEQLWLRMRSGLASTTAVATETSVAAKVSEPASPEPNDRPAVSTKTVSTKSTAAQSDAGKARPFSFLNRGARDVVSEAGRGLNSQPAVRQPDQAQPDARPAAPSGAALAPLGGYVPGFEPSVLKAEELKPGGPLAPIVLPTEPKRHAVDAAPQAASNDGKSKQAPFGRRPGRVEIRRADQTEASVKANEAPIRSDRSERELAQPPIPYAPAESR